MRFIFHILDFMADHIWCCWVALGSFAFGRWYGSSKLQQREKQK